MRPAIHWTSAITLGDTVYSERDQVRTAFPRHRLKSDTSPLLSRDVVASIPTAKRFPSGLIPWYSPFVVERRGGSSCGNRYNVARQQQQQRERRGNPGGGVSGGAGLPQDPSPRPGTGSDAQRNGISFVWCQGGMCTSYPSCHTMFGSRQSWESSPRAPHSHCAPHFYILACFIMTAG